ncbi:jhy protein homolog [Hemicordylus capensis]|uniref:jhy protein homolog n=1 Tax=Hemicordylus capensis TaxID=884348 RepID=UPI002302A4A5|nr:jhy protein homolog [Hemicordylus capensis]XP_053125543.1 jhy protein homolog [Hemicordylus capensis]XP_053125545.1 jhy protein homolog [Hemicordylus capensis]XP_053125546.1 jhy protein homolog [Hemicordylus capensis]XP_053125547.1 jhy protein homolog [Hemicordylus capensis]XP_053125548.1 jhy protein homolog [Hemicordylus capensis]
MSASSPLKKGLFQPHVHYSFLKTASEGLSLSEEDFHSSMHDSPESDSESLAQEIQYQFELQKRIHKSEEVVGQSYDELEEDSLETDSLEEKSLTEEEQSEAEEIQTPSGSNCGEENYSKASDKEEMVDRYSDLRYDPNWKNKGVAGFTDLKESHQENGKSSPVLSLGLTCSPSQFRFIDRNNQLQKQLQRIPSIFAKEPSNSCEQPTSVSNRSDQQYKDQDNYQERVTVYHHNSNCSIYSNGSSTSTKASKRQQSEKDFVVKNKLTLGLAIPPHNSYLHLHGKMQREGTKDSSSIQRPSDGLNKPRYILERKLKFSRAPTGSQHGGHHNVLEFENTQTSSDSYGEVPDLEEEGRCPLNHRLYPKLPITPLQPFIVNNSAVGQTNLFHRDSSYIVHQNGKETNTSLAFARNPLQSSSYQNFPGLPSPCSSEKNKQYQHNPKHTSGYRQQYPYRCTISEPQSVSRYGTSQKPLGQKCFSYLYNAALQQPGNTEASAWNPKKINTEKTPSNYVSGNSGSSQPSAPDLRSTPSPATWLIQAAEHHHQEISRLVDDHLAGSQFTGMLPPIIQRGESDWQLNMESSEESQPVLSRSNSEGYLLQVEKKKEKKNRKGSRTKGYMKMDVNLGGLGPDYETIREKSEKIKQKKEYAKQIKEHNMKSITSAQKPQPRPENKSSLSRQKALEYAKKIPKPKVYLSRPPEQEPKDDQSLVRPLDGENLPPISSLESLQNRHEKEKQVVAAFKTLHIV